MKGNHTNFFTKKFQSERCMNIHHKKFVSFRSYESKNKYECTVAFVFFT